MEFEAREFKILYLRLVCRVRIGSHLVSLRPRQIRLIDRTYREKPSDQRKIYESHAQEEEEREEGKVWQDG